MNDIQRQVVELLGKMDEAQQSDVLQYANRVLEDGQATNLTDFLKTAARLRAELRAKYGDRLMTSSADILEQVREERDEEIENALKSRG